MNLKEKLKIAAMSVVASTIVTALVIYTSSFFDEELFIASYLFVLFAHLCYTMYVLKAEIRNLKSEIAMDNTIIAFQHAMLKKQMEEEEEELEKATK